MLNNIYAGKRVLVTGATGLIGSNLVSRLLNFDGINVVAVGRNKGKMEQVFASKQENKSLVLLEHDISKPLPKSLGCLDAVFHAAGPMSGGVIQEDPVSVIKANLNGLANCLNYLAEQKRDLGIVGMMAVFSSITIYGGRRSSDIGVLEEESEKADSLDSSYAPYSESKRMIEVMAKAFARQYGIDVKIARFGTVYGYCPIPPATAFYEFIGKAIKGEDLVFLKSGFPRRDNIFIDDAVSGLLHICEYGKSGESYNVSSNGYGGNFAAIDEVAAEIARVANLKNGRNVRVVVQGERKHVDGVKLDNNKLVKLGWNAQVPLTEGIRKTLMAYDK